MMDGGALQRDLDARLRAEGIFNKVKDVIRSHCAESSKEFDGFEVNETAAMTSILTYIRDQASRGLNPTSLKAPMRRDLVVYIDGGKAFVDNLLDQDPQEVKVGFDTSPTFNGGGDREGTFELTMQLGGHRVRTQRVRATVEPDFGGECYRFPLQSGAESMPSIDSLLDLRLPLHIRLVKREKHGGNPTLIACQEFEWRKVLVHGKLQVSIPLKGVGNLKGPAGLLEIRLEIRPLRLPAIKESVEEKGEEGKMGIMLPVFVPETSVEKQIEHEQRVEAGVLRRFFAYAKAWWREYSQVRPSHRHRLVRLFARSSDGSQGFVTTFLNPIQAPRMLDSSLHAARFVTLIPKIPEISLVGAGIDAGAWRGSQTHMALRGGTQSDKALLLTSLLLGFGLDAYVCIGIRNRDDRGKNKTEKDIQPPEAMVVITRVTRATVCIWEPVTGRRGQLDAKSGWTPITQASSNWSCPLESVHCVFNHQQLYANLQPIDKCDACNWDLGDQTKWKAFSQEAIQVLPRFPGVVLLPYSGDRLEQEAKLEMNLKELVAQHRKDELKVDTIWSDSLAYMLTPALAAYEAERCTKTTYGNPEFQQAIKRNIPVGHVFKAVPFCFNHRNPRRMFTAFLGLQGKSVSKGTGFPSAVDILKSKGDSIRFALRVRVFKYPEDICAVWAILAVKYRDVD
ncbi:hypothetical protein AAMO2058_000580700 [Amorphochlora amoebiformis]